MNPSQRRIEPASSEDLAERASWHYEPPYDFYNDDGKPVKNPECFFAGRDDAGALFGLMFFGDRRGAVFFGLGMRRNGSRSRPRVCTHGVEFAHERFPAD